MESIGIQPNITESNTTMESNNIQRIDKIPSGPVQFGPIGNVKLHIPP